MRGCVVFPVKDFECYPEVEDQSDKFQNVDVEVTLAVTFGDFCCCIELLEVDAEGF